MSKIHSTYNITPTFPSLHPSNYNNNNTNNKVSIPCDNNGTQQNENPLQATFSFPNITITSAFDSGNLSSCVKTSETSFALEIGSDCQGQTFPHQISSYKIWFYFAVKSHTSYSQHITFTITNMNNFIKLFRKGYKIVYKTLKSSYTSVNDFERSYETNEEYEWNRLMTEHNVCLTSNTQNPNLVELSFDFTFDSNDCYTLFAFCFPWSYEKNQCFINYLSNKVDEYNNATPNTNHKIYYHNEILTLSKQKRYINIITITSYANIIKKQYEKKLNGLFPYKNQTLKTLHDKPVIFISARVHPGETPGAYVMNGILKMLTDGMNPLTRILLTHFVFKIIPIINVDGVANGHFRLDTTGLNLNRCYLSPDIKTDPEIFAIKKLFLYYNTDYKVRYYFDLHADMNVEGVYTFGNALPDFCGHVENVLFTYLFKVNCSNVNWERCTFSEGSMRKKFKFDKVSKEATSRVHFYTLTGLIHTYTVESTYFRGDFKNTNTNNNEMCYQVEDFMKVGKDLLSAVLDYEELNESAMLHENEYKNISECRNYIANMLVKEEERFKFDLKYRSIAKDIDSERKWLSVKEMGDKYANPFRKKMRSNAPSERAMFKYSLPLVRDVSRKGMRNASVIRRGEYQNGEEKNNDNSEVSSKYNTHNVNANNNNITVIRNSNNSANNTNGKNFISVRKNKFQCKIEFKNCKSFRDNNNENNKNYQLQGDVNSNKNYDGVDVNVNVNTNHNNLKLWDNKKDKWTPFSKTGTNPNTSHHL